MPAKARHRTPPALWPRVLFPLLAVIALAAGFIPGLVSASAAPATPAAVTLASRGAAFPADELSPVQEQARLAATRAQLAARRAAALAAARTYAVRPGDSLSAVAARHCGQARDWTGIYAASRARGWTARNANVLIKGQHLWLACTYDARQLRFAPAPPPPPVIRTVVATASTAGTGHGYAVRTYHRAYAPVSASRVSPAGYGGYQACVITRESGGQVNVMNASGHYGLYQFDYGTWVSGGGAGADFGHASVAEQNRVFAAVYAARGTQPWSPSDHC